MNGDKNIDIPIVPEDAVVPSGMMTTFYGYYNYDGQPKAELTMRTEAVTLDEMLPAFEDFLRGMGFHINGHLEIVNEEDEG